ncbi:hypothetical protein WR25_02971 isoform D [Diploscapter pachys]|nr:hypothetical protein WR25_02971 isoform D [Diploscapter pachys]
MTSPAYMSSALRPDNRALYSWPTRFYSPSQAIDNLPTRRLSYLDSAQIEGPLSPPHRPPLLEHQLTSPLRTQMNYPLGAMATSDILPITGIPINTLNAPVVERPPPPLDKARLEREALFANYSLSFQRILFYFTRYPAIVMIFVASWVLWGRGLGEGKPQNETVAYSVGFATGITAILANVVLTLNHHYKYKKARYLSNLYHIAAVLSFCGATVSLIFSAIVFSTVKNIKIFPACRFSKYNDLSDHQAVCLNTTDRRNYLGVLIGVCSLMIIITFFQMLYGVIGQSQMRAKLRRARNRATQQQGHQNQAFHY